jgi:thiamine biosynthesis lipoprotein
MKQTQIIMGMPITIEIIDARAADHFDVLFDYFRAVDERYSTYKETSEISRINRGLPPAQWSDEMRQVIGLCEETNRATKGYFDIVHNGQRDPSGLVKGWSIHNASEQLRQAGVRSFYVEAGGDIEVNGCNERGEPWLVGIRSPFNMDEIVKSLRISTEGVATYPHHPGQPIDDVKSLTVVGPNVYEADRFATAAFAMGLRGIEFIAATPGLEGYMIDSDKIATYTDGFERYTG